MGEEPGSTTAPPDAKRRPVVSVTIRPAQPVDDLSHPPKTWMERLRGPEGVSFTISVIVHLVLGIILAIPMMDGAFREDSIFTTIRDAEENSDSMAIGAIIEAPELMMEKSMTADELLAPPVNESAPYLPIPENAKTADSAASPGDQDGDSTADLAGAVGGYLLQEPDNAVKAGRFAAFSRPITRNAIGNIEAEYGEPGDPPIAGQNYFIVIQIRVGEQRKTYPVGDLVGNVVGTDGYRQQFPKFVYYLDEEGKPQKINRSKPIRVINGVVQLLMEVPGAAAEVRDNIYLKSKMLKEEQNLQLIFQAQRPPTP